MPIEVRMPQPFSSNDEGTIAKWLIKEGQRVNPGDVMAEIETDEATVEIEAVEGGRVARLLVAEGTCHVKVYAPILLEEAGAGAATTVAHGPGAEDTAKVESTRAAPPIARTRLVGAHAQSPSGSRFARRGDAAGQANTEFVRPDQTPVDPVAGWVVVVQGPGRGAFRPRVPPASTRAGRSMTPT
jgi:pyruvate dehydrogenase E2 component (dihydrolipoamide acetyltransferase)